MSLHQRGDRLVEARQVDFQLSGAAVVVVPAAEGEGDDARACLDEAPGHQELLVAVRAAVVHVLHVAFAVAFADFRILFAEVEGVDEFAGGENIVGALVQVVHAPQGVDAAAEAVQAGEQAAAVVEAVQRDAVEGHVGHQFAVGAHGGVAQAEEAGIARVAPLHVAHLRGEPDEGRDGLIDLPLQFGDDGAEAWHMVLRDFGGGVAALADMGVVFVARADEGANDRELVHHLRDVGHQFADLDAGHFGLDRLEVAANVGGRVHLQVEHILVRRPAGQVDHDAGFVTLLDPALRLGTQHVGEGHPPSASPPI